MNKTKILFNIINTIFVILYIYPGSILGYLVYGTARKQPQLTPDFMSISSNHVYAFFVLSLIGLFAYYRSSKVIILIYLIKIKIKTKTFSVNLTKIILFLLAAKLLM